MSTTKTQFQAFLKEETDKVKGIYYPVRMPFLFRILTKTARTRALHPNPEDEFCRPSIGPNYEIISRYEQDYRNGATKDVRRNSAVQEPITVQKAKPDGYLILNGHHRWAAAMRAGVRRLQIKVINVTGQKDVRDILSKSRSDKRITLDLDEVVFAVPETEEQLLEKPLRFPLSRYFPERVWLGVPALLNKLRDRGYDIWVYTVRYDSVDRIRYFFKHWNVNVTGIITCMRRISSDAEVKKMLETKYRSTVHIGRDLVVRTFSGENSMEEYSLSGDAGTWAREVMEAFDKMRAEDDRRS